MFFFLGKCEQHVCRTSHYCLNTESTICDVMPHYCIDKSLVCDGLPNCSEDDYSDEEKCKHNIFYVFRHFFKPIYENFVLMTCFDRFNLSPND